MGWFENTFCPNQEEEKESIMLFLRKYNGKETILPEESMHLEDWMFIFSLEESSCEKMPYGHFYFGLSQSERTGKFFYIGLSFLTDAISHKEYEWKVRMAKLISPTKIAQISFSSSYPSDAVDKLMEVDWFHENPLFPERSKKPLLPILEDTIQSGALPKELFSTQIEYSFFNLEFKGWNREI